jgi:hypothetical protein
MQEVELILKKALVKPADVFGTGCTDSTLKRTMSAAALWQESKRQRLEF